MVHVVLFFSTVLAFSKRHRKILFFISFLMLFFFAMLRYGYGNDYMSYYRWFDIIKSGDSSPYKNQIGFTFLNQIMPNFYCLIAVTSFIFVWGIYKLVKDNLHENLYGFAVLIFLINPYLFLMNLSAIRQSIAMILFIIALDYARKKRVILYILFVLLGTLFHTSAILLLPLYFLANDKKISKTAGIITAVVLVVLFLSTSLFADVVQNVLAFFGTERYYTLYGETMGNSLRATILSSIYLVYIILNINKLSGKALMYTKLYMASMILAVFAYHISMFTRMQMYVDVFSIIALPSIFDYNFRNAKKKWDRVMNVYVFPILILLIYILRYYTFFTNPMWKSFTTYQTLFEVIL